MAPFLIAALFSGAAFGVPSRGAPQKPASVAMAPGKDPHRLIVKLKEERNLRFDGARANGPQPLVELNVLLAGSEPLFTRSAASLRNSKRPGLADLSLYRVLHSVDAIAVGNQLLRLPSVENAYLASTPVPPPADIPPETADFSVEQTYGQPGPEGFGFDVARGWPGGDGANVTIADIEYGFDPDHEDLVEVDVLSIGEDHNWYQFHGNGVLGMLASPDNGYGVTGLVTGAEFLMVSPFVSEGFYNVADAIDLAAAHMTAGDVLLIEQQGWVDDVYTPVEVDAAVFDAIAAAVDAGITVIEPAGNGACDLDDPIWEGAFDSTERDSGAIIVGGGASPFSGLTPRSYHPLGSCFGERVDVQGWFDHITTLSAADGAPSYTDLFYPEQDGRQAYTALFGGTSGAAPMVAAIAAVMNSVAIETRGEAWDPWDLRAAIRSTGHPQTGDPSKAIGTQPDLRRLLRTYGIR